MWIKLGESIVLDAYERTMTSIVTLDGDPKPFLQVDHWHLHLKGLVQFRFFVYQESR